MKGEKKYKNMAKHDVKLLDYIFDKYNILSIKKTVIPPKKTVIPPKKNKKK